MLYLMKFGYVLKHYEKLSENPEILENRTRNIEEIGFDSIWITDHILLPRGTRLPEYETITENITTLSYLAGITNKLNMGFSTLVLPLRDPILVAKQLSTIYYFIRDRLKITFGAGWSEKEFDQFNQSFDDRGDRFDEQLQIIRALWEGRDHFSGKYYSYENSIMNPRSIGLEEIPMYIAGNSNRAIERSIKYGNGWHPVNLSYNELTAKLEQYPELDPENIILRYSVAEEEIDSQVAKYEDLGINTLIFDDQGDLEKFERIITYIRSFQEFQP